MRRERVKNLLDQAAKLPTQDRRAFIESTAGDDPAAASEAIDLLATLDDSLFMNAPTGAGVTQTMDSGVPAFEAPGAKIGRYKLLQPLGEGGFGAVFMAEQTEPVIRRVALKIIKAGMDTRQVIARFEAERQALAMMDHPSIARVLDAGATHTGRPYFVMELVRGDPVTTYCDREKLPVEQRLRVFQAICSAVHHAHQKGIIHRDIKPTNVLVTVADGKPLPKVIDFGIAKATAVRLTDRTLFTEMQQIIGTPEYMSPEQAEVSGVDIDTRSDIYSLGVLLYELLVGEPPFAGRRLRSAPFAEMQRIIRDEEPPRPSLRMRTLTGSSSQVQPERKGSTLPADSGSSAIDIARRRQTEPQTLARSLSGDLDWIVMKCLSKERDRRYETASDLVADIDRYLGGHPVNAAPPAKIYRLQKFMRRNRAQVIFGTFIFIALLAGLVMGVKGYVSALDARASAESARESEAGERRRAEAALAQAQINAQRAEEQSKRAGSEAAKALAVSDFLQRLLASVSPGATSERGEVTVRETIERSVKALDKGELAAQPEVEATIRGTIGRVFRALGDDRAAKNQLERAIALAEKGALAKLDLAILRNDLGHTLRDLGDVDAAERVYLTALEEMKAVGESATASIGGVYNSLAGIAMSRKQYDKAREYYDGTLEALGPPEGKYLRQILLARANRAVLLKKQGDVAGAEAELKDVSERIRASIGDKEPFLVQVETGLAITMAEQGRTAQATEVLRQALADAKAIFPPRHPTIIYVLTQIGGLSWKTEAWADAERAYGEALEAFEANAEARLTREPDLLNGYCVAIEMQGEAARAEAKRRAFVADARQDNSPAELATALANLGRNLMLQKRWADAEPVVREALELRRRALADDEAESWLISSAAGMLGEAIFERARIEASAALFAEAEPLVLEAAESLPGNAHVPVHEKGLPDKKREALDRAVRLYDAWHLFSKDEAYADKAKQWQARVGAVEHSR